MIRFSTIEKELANTDEAFVNVQLVTRDVRNREDFI